MIRSRYKHSLNFVSILTLLALSDTASANGQIDNLASQGINVNAEDARFIFDNGLNDDVLKAETANVPIDFYLKQARLGKRAREIISLHYKQLQSDASAIGSAQNNVTNSAIQPNVGPQSHSTLGNNNSNNTNVQPIVKVESNHATPDEIQKLHDEIAQLKRQLQTAVNQQGLSVVEVDKDFEKDLNTFFDKMQQKTYTENDAKTFFQNFVSNSSNVGAFLDKIDSVLTDATQSFNDALVNRIYAILGSQMLPREILNTQNNRAAVQNNAAIQKLINECATLVDTEVNQLKSIVPTLKMHEIVPAALLLLVDEPKKISTIPSPDAQLLIDTVQYLSINQCRALFYILSKNFSNFNDILSAVNNNSFKSDAIIFIKLKSEIDKAIALAAKNSMVQANDAFPTKMLSIAKSIVPIEIQKKNIYLFRHIIGESIVPSDYAMPVTFDTPKTDDINSQPVVDTTSKFINQNGKYFKNPNYIDPKSNPSVPLAPPPLAPANGVIADGKQEENGPPPPPPALTNQIVQSQGSGPQVLNDSKLQIALSTSLRRIGYSIKDSKLISDLAVREGLTAKAAFDKLRQSGIMLDVKVDIDKIGSDGTLSEA